MAGAARQPVKKAQAPARCRAHQALAGWQCTRCHEVLCPECAGTMRVGPAELVACTLCGEQAEPLRRHRREGGTLLERLPRAFTFPFRGEGLLALGSLSLLGLLVVFGGCAALLVLGLTVGAIFAVVRFTARGGDHLESEGFTDLHTSVLLPVLRFVVATAPVWGGGIMAWRAHSAAGGVLVGLAAALWVPMALLAAAANSPFTAMLNPLLMVGLALKLGRDYWVYLGGLLGCGVAAVVGLVLGVFVGRLPLPVVGQLLVNALALAPLLTAAHIGGLLLYLRGDTLGWGTAEDYAEPVLGQEAPRGALPERGTAAARGGHRAPIELPPDLPPAGASSDVDAVFAQRPDFGRAAPRAALDPRAPPARAVLDEVSEAGRAVRAAMAKGDGAAALHAWEDAGRLVPELTVSELGWLGRAAASRGDDAVALSAFEAAAFAGSGDDVASVRVMLARLLDERLGRADEARRWMQRVAGEAPEGEARRFARQWLSQRG